MVFMLHWLIFSFVKIIVLSLAIVRLKFFPNLKLSFYADKIISQSYLPLFLPPVVPNRPHGGSGTQAPPPVPPEYE